MTVSLLTNRQGVRRPDKPRAAAGEDPRVADLAVELLRLRNDLQGTFATQKAALEAELAAARGELEAARAEALTTKQALEAITAERHGLALEVQRREERLAEAARERAAQDALLQAEVRLRTELENRPAPATPAPTTAPATDPVIIAALQRLEARTAAPAPAAAEKPPAYDVIVHRDELGTMRRLEITQKEGG